MSDASGDERPSPSEFIEEALIEAHHLANLTGLDEAKLARRRLVNAQSATRRTKTRDLLADACEYLELARLERRDAAAGFAKARRYARNAQIGLRHERRAAVERSVAELLAADLPSERRTLQDFRREQAVTSYDVLKRDTALEVTFAEIRSQATDGVIENPNAFDGDDLTDGEDHDRSNGHDGTNGNSQASANGNDHEEPRAEGVDLKMNAERAIELASLEVDIRRALQKTRGAYRDSEFEFVSNDDLVAEEATETS